MIKPVELAAKLLDQSNSELVVTRLEEGDTRELGPRGAKVKVERLDWGRGVSKIDTLVEVEIKLLKEDIVELELNGILGPRLELLDGDSGAVTLYKVVNGTIAIVDVVNGRLKLKGFDRAVSELS